MISLAMICKIDLKLNNINADGDTPLLMACRDHNKDTQLVKHIINLGKIKKDITDKNKCTALMYTCHYNHTNTTIELLNNLDTPINHCNKIFGSVLNIACKNNMNEIACRLLNMGCKTINVMDKDKQTAIMYIEKNNMIGANLMLTYIDNGINDKMKTCSICQSNISVHGFMHDNSVHSGFCYECANTCLTNTGTCPICRQTIEKIVTIYTS